jgi:hypothetical protein
MLRFHESFRFLLLTIIFRVSSHHDVVLIIHEIKIYSSILDVLIMPAPMAWSAFAGGDADVCTDFV